MRRTPLLPSILFLLANSLACFEDPASSGNGDGDSSSGDGDGSSEDGDGDGETTGDSAPSFASFTVNASPMPSVVEAASAVVVTAEIADPDDVAYIVFRRDGETISTQDGPGTSFSVEWLVSGAEFNGTYSFDAEVYDSNNDSLAASDVIELPIAMPASGEVDAWSHDGGEVDRAHDVWVDDEGESVVITGQTSVMLVSQMRTDRVVGPPWLDKSDAGALFGSALAKRETGGFFVSGATAVGMDSSNTALFHYGDDGTLIDSFNSNVTSQVTEDYDYAIDVERAPGGVVMLGFYRLGGANDWNSYVRRYTNGFDVEYTRFPSETLAGKPTALSMSAIEDGSFALAGGRFGQQPTVPWVGRFDSNGELTSEIVSDDVDGGFFYAAHLGNDGALTVGGQVLDGADALSWLRSYDPAGELRFDVSIPNSSLGIVAAVAVDPWGEVVAVSTEGCVLSNDLSYRDCALVVRKFDAEGSLMWEERYDNSAFLGPELLLPGMNASVALDRYGYIYVTAIADSIAGTDWWARKLHP